MKQKINFGVFFLVKSVNSESTDTTTLAPGQEYHVTVDVTNTWISPLFRVRSELIHSDGTIETIQATRKIPPSENLKQEVTTKAGSTTGNEILITTVKRFFISKKVVTSRRVEVAVVPPEILKKEKEEKERKAEEEKRKAEEKRKEENRVKFLP